MDDNLQPKNEYLLKKQEKEEMAQAERRKKLIKKGLWWLVILAVLILIGWRGYGYFKKAAVEGERPKPGQYFQAQSRDHIKPGAEHPAYNSNPPTGGWHYDQPAQSGIYDKEFSDEQLIHNLEHSHIWIVYKPDLPADQVEKLADIAKDYGSKIIMTLRPANDTKIALVAWEYLLTMDAIDEVNIRKFIDYHRGVAGPEKIPDFGFKDFRTKK